MTSDKKKDFLWILAVSVLILFWGSIPTWTGYQLETQELRFRGIYFDSQDYAVHLATMQAGMQGEWAYQFRFTTEPHRAAFLKLFYIVLGHFSRWFGLAPDSTYHLARWLLGLLALFALYKLMRQIFADLFWARIAFLLAALGSGLGWLQLIFDWTSSKITPIDFWVIGDYIFFSLSIFPHFAFVTALTCFVVSLWLDFLKQPRWANIPWIGLASILVQFVNPIAFAPVDASLFGAMLFSFWQSKKTDKEQILALFAIAVTQIPLLIYNFVVLSNDPLWSQFTAQNQTLSPPPEYYLWGFALFWPLTVLGLILAFRTKSAALGGAFFWIIAGFLLAYAPVYIQRRFLQNITIPFAILATAGLIQLFETGAARIPGLFRWRSSLILLVVFLISLSSIQIGLGQAAYLRTYPETLFYPAGLDQAAGWFGENARYNDFVLASEQTSQVLAQKTGLRAYLGHPMETLDYQTKLANVQAFFQGGSTELAGRPIKWVVYGPLEQTFNPVFQPMQNLELVYEHQDVKIFQVK
jgi:hypothetical protein